MTLRKPAELAASLEPGERLMGLDVGSKTIGIALSDPRLVIASARATIRRGRFRDDAHALFEMIEAEGVGGLVIGLPINMDGGEGPRCQSVRQFAANLMELRDQPIAFWDERLSTVAAERALIEADVSRRRRARLIDKVAAAVILQGALDFLAGRREPGGSAERH